MTHRFYITTPIYYINAAPHVGSAYTTLAADTLARYHRVRGHDVRFLTGTDEHGQKIERVAVERGISPEAFADETAAHFQAAWPKLGIAPDDFIRTTEPRHVSRAQELWRRVADRGDIYLGQYEGWYCVADEAFYTEKDLVNGLSPTGRPVERVREESYFFRLSKYTDILLDFYERHPTFVQPDSRFNEVKSFVRGGLEDLSVSRTSFTWGVPVPGDPRHVMYVWFDALANYWTALGGDDDALQRFWPPDVHLVGKEISRFHAVYWPAFLLGAGFGEAKLPKRVYAHGWLTVDGSKMSKSAGNVVDPLKVADEIGADALRFYLLSAIAFGHDGDFNHQDLLARRNNQLADDLGNLLNRTLGLCARYSEGKSTASTPVAPNDDIERALWESAIEASVHARDSFDAVAPHRAIEAIWKFCREANSYVDRAAPWAAAKRGDKASVETTLASLLEACRWLSILLAPVLPEKAAEMRRQLGLAPLATAIDNDLWPVDWRPRPAGEPVGPAVPLFPKLDADAQKAVLARLVGTAESTVVHGAPTPAGAKAEAGARPTTQRNVAEATPLAAAPALAEPSTESAAPASAPAGVAEPLSPPIAFDVFAQTDLRVGLIVEAVRVPKKDKLLDLRVDLGEGQARRIVAGLAQSFAPEALVGKRVIVVANLAPRDFGKGLVSHGMILAASAGDALTLPAIDPSVRPGTKVK